MSYDDETDGFGSGGAGQTRTRLPGGGTGDVYGGARRPARNSRSLVMVAGVVVLLVSAIAFANRGDGTVSPGTTGTAKGTTPTAATGIRPVAGKHAGIPAGYTKDQQGAQSAAANYAVALGSVGMFQRDSRHTIVDRIYTTEAAAKLKGPQDSAYSAAFLERLGLDPEGNAPVGSTFVSRTIPVGTQVEAFSGDTARISVWYTGLIGMSGEASTDPVRTTWKTWTFDLRWTGNDWKVVQDSEKDGPAPVPGDITASTSDEISQAVQEFGGFTYAR
ncbi:hypothetical protein SSP531S_53480 [Streptomyces spongiicola]|uniref:Uncharacterized protein n=1 Tax=Streptomyces spongiicola TaxID=1690221 RepID=A0A388T750_9ACTN|nr:hypothetical protein [Streptomyces spongiicola]GBQ03870.1 hypothetical protein SSP531S_53480 [Streptomyces spongiicola]